ncbi:isoaspartyl peptidase/L-asparaginase [Pelomyxa schiedti]|nr:isoaspartyl peptidase/L-asparaginase [Pelomyxa schiedti]
MADAVTSGTGGRLHTDSQGPQRRVFSLALHGGAGVISKKLPPDVVCCYMRALARIVLRCRDLMVSHKAATAVDVAQAAVMMLEDCELFNAGRGAVFNHDGIHELEACIMDGRNLATGAASLLKCVKNPIAAARLVMDKTDHAIIAGPAAERLAAEHNLEIVEQSYFSTDVRRAQLQSALAAKMVTQDHATVPKPLKPYLLHVDNLSLPMPRLSSFLNGCHEGSSINKTDGGNTVGCVVMLDGNVAAATSTGGRTNKMCGRMGDTPIVGAGTYANNATCAISGTGNGEEFQRRCTAHEVSAIMQYGGRTLEDACKMAVTQLPPGCGGVIAVTAALSQSACVAYNSKGMFRAICTPEVCCVGIWEQLFCVEEGDV